MFCQKLVFRKNPVLKFLRAFEKVIATYFAIFYRYSLLTPGKRWFYISYKSTDRCFKVEAVLLKIHISYDINVCLLRSSITLAVY